MMQAGTTVDTARTQTKKATEQYLEERSADRNVDGGLQLQLEKKDGGGSTRQN